MKWWNASTCRQNRCASRSGSLFDRGVARRWEWQHHSSKNPPPHCKNCWELLYSLHCNLDSAPIYLVNCVPWVQHSVSLMTHHHHSAATVYQHRWQTEAAWDSDQRDAAPWTRSHRGRPRTKHLYQNSSYSALAIIGQCYQITVLQIAACIYLQRLVWRS